MTLYCIKIEYRQFQAVIYHNVQTIYIATMTEVDHEL